MNEDDEFEEGNPGRGKFYKDKSPKANLALVKKIYEDQGQQKTKGKKKKHDGPGQPPFFDTPEKLEQMVGEYIIFCDDKRLNMTITGLALFLGFADRHSLYDYEKRDDFSHTIKRARSVIEMAYEDRLHSGSAGGPIFALKNFGWTDIQITEHRGAMPITIKKNYEGKDPEKEGDKK